MIDPSRLSALESYRPDDDTPDSAKVSIPAGDLRDLVALIPYARKAAQLEAILEKTMGILGKTGDLLGKLPIEPPELKGRAG